MIGICKAFFRKTCALWRRISLQARVVFNLVAILLILTVPAYLVYIESSFLNDMEAGFRLEEQQRMVGPSNILGVAEVSGFDKNDRLVVAESEEGLILCDYSTQSGKYNNFNYIHKNESFTIAASLGNYNDNDKNCNILVLLDNQPNAVRAELTIEAKEIGSGEIMHTVDVSSCRESAGFFLFYVTSRFTRRQLAGEGYADVQHDCIKHILSRSNAAYKCYCTVRVHLYDKNNALIEVKESDVYFPDNLRT